MRARRRWTLLLGGALLVLGAALLGLLAWSGLRARGPAGDSARTLDWMGGAGAPIPPPRPWNDPLPAAPPPAAAGPSLDAPPAAGRTDLDAPPRAPATGPTVAPRPPAAPAARPPPPSGGAPRMVWTALPPDHALTVQVWSALRCVAGGPVAEDAALTRAARDLGERVAQGGWPTERAAPALTGRRAVVTPLLPPALADPRAPSADPDACVIGGIAWRDLPLAHVRRAGVVVLQRLDDDRQVLVSLIAEE